MADALRKVLLLDTARDADWVDVALASGDSLCQSEVIRCDAVAAVVDVLQTSPVDLVIVDLSVNLQDGLEAIRRIRDAEPAVPLVVVTNRADDEAGLLAIRAGAQDHIVKGENTGQRLALAVSYAIERSRVLDQIETAKETEAREREFQSLKHLCGPAPLPIAGRSFGSIPLRDRSPQAFLELARQYEHVLVRSPAARSFQHREQIADELNVIADRLGLLNAGPRDVIDVHKMAIAKRLEGLSLGRARAAIEDGRMLLLQLMGYLVSFYRNLSWGAATSGRSRASPGRILTNPEAIARKNET